MGACSFVAGNCLSECLFRVRVNLSLTFTAHTGQTPQDASTHVEIRFDVHVESRLSE